MFLSPLRDHLKHAILASAHFSAHFLTTFDHLSGRRFSLKTFHSRPKKSIQCGRDEGTRKESPVTHFSQMLGVKLLHPGTKISLGEPSSHIARLQQSSVLRRLVCRSEAEQATQYRLPTISRKNLQPHSVTRMNPLPRSRHQTLQNLGQRLYVFHVETNLTSSRILQRIYVQDPAFSVSLRLDCQIISIAGQHSESRHLTSSISL